jgi:hypothetical protein
MHKISEFFYSTSFGMWTLTPLGQTVGEYLFAFEIVLALFFIVIFWDEVKDYGLKDWFLNWLPVSPILALYEVGICYAIYDFLK